jgi:hypothetical protein
VKGLSEGMTVGLLLCVPGRMEEGLSCEYIGLFSSTWLLERFLANLDAKDAELIYFSTKSPMINR